MKTKIFCCLMAMVMCALLFGCGGKDGSPAPAVDLPPQDIPEGQVQDEPETPAQSGPEGQDTTQPSPEPAEEPDAAPEETAQPVEPLPPEPAETNDVSADYVGTWWDDARGTSGGRCFMEIACPDGVNYSIDIWWGSSAAETAHWQYTGTYDEDRKGIGYTGTRYRETTQADGTVERTVELEEATGLIYLEDGALLWEDPLEHTGDGMKFQKAG